MLKNPHCSVAMSAEHMSTLQSFTGNGDVSIWVKNSRVGLKTPNEQSKYFWSTPCTEQHKFTNAYTSVLYTCDVQYSIKMLISLFFKIFSNEKYAVVQNKSINYFQSLFEEIFIKDIFSNFCSLNCTWGIHNLEVVAGKKPC